MSANKYSNALTIILVITIIVILLGGGFLVYNYIIKPYNGDKEVAQAISEFDKMTEEGNIEEEPQEEVDMNKIAEKIETTQSQSGNSGTKKIYYKDFVMIGYISIPKTDVELPILEETTPKALETSVAVLYPSNNIQLNEAGNTVIIGHNRKNGTFFSNNKKLSVGDKVLIKDTSGRELTYIIYQKFEADDTDASFYNRDTNGVPEITLSCCTDNEPRKRIIIFAKAQ